MVSEMINQIFLVLPSVVIGVSVGTIAGWRLAIRRGASPTPSVFPIPFESDPVNDREIGITAERLSASRYGNPDFAPFVASKLRLSRRLLTRRSGR
jgi:hypothetical protein